MPLKYIKRKKALKTIELAQKRPEPIKMVQLLIPLYDKKGKSFSQSLYKNLEKKLVKDFGGVTSYAQSPANGHGQMIKKREIKDKVIVYEVMISEIDLSYWEGLKKILKKQFEQENLIIRQSKIGLL